MLARGRSRWKACGLALLLAGATFLAYYPAWQGGFIWDDDAYVTANPLLTAPDGLKRIWFSLDAPSQYFPLTYTTFRMERSFWGLNPTGYHLVNIALHLANALLLWRLLGRLRIPGAWLASIIFAWHPVQVESVAWITERKNVLMAFFFLLSLLGWVAFLRTDERRRRGWFYLLSLLAFSAALFAKTTACTLPAALLLIIWLEQKRVDARRVWQVVPFVVFGLAMGLVTIWWERFHQGTHGVLFSLGPLERLLLAARGFWFYLFKLVWPARLTFIYPQWKISATAPLLYLFLAALILLAIWLWRTRRSYGPGPAVAFLFYLATLAPLLGFFMLYTFRYTYVADHYQYLAAIGPIALAAAGLVRLAQKTDWRWVGRIGGAVLPGVLWWLTFQQSRMYRDLETLWTVTIARNPNCWLAYNNLGVLMVGRGQTDLAIEKHGKSLELYPDFAETHYNLANALLQKGEVSEALSHAIRAVELRPGNADSHITMGNARLAEGKLDPAIEEYSTAVQLDPRSADAHYNLGNALQLKGAAAEAMSRYQEAIRLRPEFIEPHLNMGNLFIFQGREAEALPHYEAAVKIAPDSKKALNNLAWVYATAADPRLRNQSRAVSLAEQADAKTGGRDSTIAYTLAAAYAGIGRFDQATETARRGLQLAAAEEQKELAAELRRVISLYEQHKAYQP